MVRTVAALRLKNGYAHGELMTCVENNIVYSYDATSEAQDDGATVIRPVLTGAGRWIKVKRMEEYGELPAVATTVAASSVTALGATLNGSINANDADTTVSFEYGETTAYGETSPATPEVVSGNPTTNVSADITGLTPATAYHFRVVAVSEAGTSHGSDLTFTTGS